MSRVWGMQKVQAIKKVPSVSIAAGIDLVIRDLKDQALAHFPSGNFNANSAWTVIAALAHNLASWTTLIGLPDRPVQTANTRRRHLLAIHGRPTRTSRQWTLRMPARWPWQHDSPPSSTRSARSRSRPEPTTAGRDDQPPPAHRAR